jgi:FkbM family methyltransferase
MGTVAGNLAGARSLFTGNLNMMSVKRPAPFILVSSNHGTLIVNRNDYCMDDQGNRWGVGHQILQIGSHDQREVDVILALLERRRQHFGSGVVAVDCAANIGVHTVEWARAMYGWGEVLAFEAQEKLFYALAGNVMINNCLNVTARHCAVGASCSQLEIPEPDYFAPASFGSLELKETARTEFIGQKIDYRKTRPVAQISIDSLRLKRLDLIKIDVERMEEDVLAGATESIAAHFPVMMIEVLKTDPAIIERLLLSVGYKCYPLGYMLLAVHSGDPLSQYIGWESGVPSFSRLWNYRPGRQLPKQAAPVSPTSTMRTGNPPRRVRR